MKDTKMLAIVALAMGLMVWLVAVSGASKAVLLSKFSQRLPRTV